MPAATVSTHGISLPYSSLFNINLRRQSKRQSKSRPADYFWNQATRDSISVASPHTSASQIGDVVWLESGQPAFSDSEDESLAEKKEKRKARRVPRLTRFRRIAFKAFTPKSDGTGEKVVRSTEIISQRELINDLPRNGPNGDIQPSKPISILKSWKFKTKDRSKTQVHKMVAVLKDRISASSPKEQHPKTWEEYDRCYAEEQIDVLSPPLPPPSEALRSRFYKAPVPKNESVRQLVVNRLGLFGDTPIDLTDEDAAAKSKARVEIGDKLLEQGRSPSIIEEVWKRFDHVDSASMVNIEQTGPPQNLEQHPVFRKIVKQCREIFGTALSMLSILDDDHQVFLAESGLDGMRGFSRDIGICAHTILSGRKGFMILDTKKDWRFENGPLVQTFGSRFYAGVALMAPNLDGSKESEINACPIGTLCIADNAPRESFSIEDRKKLVYMSEYARREIEKWFAKKIEHKMDQLGASQDMWNREKDHVEDLLSDGPSNRTSHSNQRNLMNFRSSGSLSTAPTSPSSCVNTSAKSPINKSACDELDSVLNLTPKTRKLFDLATKLVADTLDLSFVYLAAVIPRGEESNESGRITLISGNHIPLPVPVFNAELHLKVLRTPEGGLLYQNPSMQESEKVGFQPKISGDYKNNANPYASALLFAVGPQAQLNSGGFVLAGYTDNPKRVFGEEDVVYMKQFAHELSRSTSTLLVN